jgi:hypothetical protein
MDGIDVPTTFLRCAACETIVAKPAPSEVILGEVLAALMAEHQQRAHQQVPGPWAQR